MELAITKITSLQLLQGIVNRRNKVSFPSELSDPGSLDIPSAVDWRDKGFVPPVINEGICGNSVFFAVLDSIDAVYAIKFGLLIMGSREEGKDCCLKDNDCTSSVYDLALYQCVICLGGLAKDGEYISPNHTCISDKYSAAVKISGAQYVIPSDDEQALAVAVARQPIVVGVDATHQSFENYKSGVYYEPKCSSEKLGHAMLVVGYGSQGGEDFWIVKNSWGKILSLKFRYCVYVTGIIFCLPFSGEEWGMNGYILMARNRNNNCGIATQAMYPYY